MPQINVYDDHDIINGFGLYHDKWMHAPIFLYIDHVAWEYHALFQLQPSSKGKQPEDRSGMSVLSNVGEEAIDGS
ncbi:hypothetical protein CALVIDRAFT_542119 [Calocera viscosa TUFC12733]|uniref:Uncharacterized protein n=1 Tax=Calocera viscosa (strain TUFC12733) TaxID=1330018 RepID=A0A167GZ67_CALVF|nr:hypothetical protein CALVIDRAFT_542119 [Calocera viscosa TUFC12733]